MNSPMPQTPALGKKIENCLRDYFVAFLPAPKFMNKEEATGILDWYYKPLECLPEDCIPFFSGYCREDRDLHERAIDVLEKKADWLMTLTVSVVGFAVLRITDSEHIHVETNSWIAAQFLASWGMLCCLRARLPQTYPAPAHPIKLQEWLLKYERWQIQDREGPSMKQTSAMLEAKLHAYTAMVMKLVSEWKSKCVKGAGALLMAAFISLVVSFWIPTLSANHGGEESQRVDGAGGRGGSIPTEITRGSKGGDGEFTPTPPAESPNPALD